MPVPAGDEIMAVEITHSDRMMKEAEFQEQFIDLAHAFGYKAVHFRPALTKYGYRTPIQGDGHGWFDNIVAKEGMPLIIAELKREGEELTKGKWVGEGRKAHYEMGQEDWKTLLDLVPGIRALVFYPHDCPDRIARIFQGKE